MSKVLVIGLDGATWDLLKCWIEEGRLPTLKKLIEEGVHGVLKSTIPPLTGPAWVSFATGKNPGKHGCYDFLLPRDSLDDARTITTGDINGETFYEILDRAGKKCILINLPCSYPPRINGIVITDFLTMGDEFIFPRNLVEEIPELKRYRVIPDSHSRIKEYISDVRDLERNRFESAKRLFKKEWDFFFILFSGTDWIQHKIYDKLISGDNSEAIIFYEEIDKYVEWFVENAKDTNILIMSDHGFHTYNKMFAINKWLMGEEYLKVKPMESKGSSFREKSQKGVNVPVFLLRHQNIFKIGAFFYGIFRRIIPVTPVIRTEPDTASVAYSILSSANGNCCGIYINSKRRFGDGSVEIKDYKKVRGEIMDKLEKLREGSGKRIFKSVLRGDEVYFGECVDKAPDIVLISDEYNINSFYDEDKNANEHAIKGIFVAYGHDIKKGVKIENAEIIDLAPTILYMMDMPVQRDMDGKVLKEIFEINSELAKRLTKYQEVDERDRIKERIRRLKTRDEV
jgi:predicted AlkP superfamily phosphohydrolase/phosphomutase